MNAKETIKEIKENLHQKSSSRKDEVIVARAIMNDPNYSVDVYDKNGSTEYKPGEDFRGMISNIIASITKMSGAEANEIVKNYEFPKADAETMVRFSKEFINSYLQTGRKLPLGGRATSNIEIMWRDIPERKAATPGKTGTDRKEIIIPAHGGLKVSNTCPSWVK